MKCLCIKVILKLLFVVCMSSLPNTGHTLKLHFLPLPGPLFTLFCSYSKLPSLQGMPQDSTPYRVLTSAPWGSFLSHLCCKHTLFLYG